MELELISRRPEAAPRPTPVLFVHGAWHGAWCWGEYFLPYFAEKGYAAYALSLRGHGASAGRDRLRWSRIEDYVADVAQAVAALPELPILVGHSMGGLIVQKYLENNPARGAVLMASVPINGVLKTTLRIAGRHFFRFLWANLRFSLYPLIATPDLTREAFFSTGLPADQLKRFFDSMQDESYFAFLDMLFKRPRPDKVEAPLLILGAAEDTIFYPAEIEATARVYNVSPIMYADMAHDMMLEPGWSAVADDIIKWMDMLQMP